MKAQPELAATADRNYVGAYRKPGEHIPAGAIRSFGAVTAFTTGFRSASCPSVHCVSRRPAAGTSLAIRTADASGVYSVGTLPDARRRGVGTAVTWAAVLAGRDWGCDTIVLHASEMGFSMYRSMGFRTVVNYVTFSNGTHRLRLIDTGWAPTSIYSGGRRRKIR